MALKARIKRSSARLFRFRRAAHPSKQASAPAESQFAEDLRVSIQQMQNGDVLPTRERLQELRLELAGNADDCQSHA